MTERTTIVPETETSTTAVDDGEALVPNVLIVESDSKIVHPILETLARKGVRGLVAADEKTALDFLDKSDCDLVLANVNISPRTGGACQCGQAFSLLAKVRLVTPELPFAMIADSAMTGTAQAVDFSVRAMRSGCCDFLAFPFDRERLTQLLDACLPVHEASTLACGQQSVHTLYRIVGGSPALTKTVGLARKIAPTSASVLITGESGTGKELISSLIHHCSRRCDGPYIRVNCAALTETLLESELFGHEKGAFTGAHSQRKGRFEMAHGGTLLLDEVTETPQPFQAKLLRVIEQQDFERVGGNDTIKVNVRIISTTNKSLAREVAQGRFREDLYYRLGAVRLDISPLRQRLEDLPQLVWHFVNLYAGQTQRRITRIDDAMMDVFSRYHWPGNVRQLKNVVLTSLILGSGETLTLADVSWLFDELQATAETSPAVEANELDLDLGGRALDEIERRAILDTMRQTNGNQTRAAKILGISDRTLREKMRRYREQPCAQMSP